MRQSLYSMDQKGSFLAGPSGSRLTASVPKGMSLFWTSRCHAIIAQRARPGDAVHDVRFV